MREREGQQCVKIVAIPTVDGLNGIPLKIPRTSHCTPLGVDGLLPLSVTHCCHRCRLGWEKLLSRFQAFIVKVGQDVT